MRLTQLGIKILFIIFFLIVPLSSFLFTNKSTSTPQKLATGIFTVDQFDGNPADSLRWRDVVFEANTSGSISTADTLFRQRYRRGYFAYTLDSLAQQIAFKKFATDTTVLFTMKYNMPDTNHIILHGKIRNDSVKVALSRQKRHFQLAERQFHWVSEANR